MNKVNSVICFFFSSFQPTLFFTMYQKQNSSISSYSLGKASIIVSRPDIKTPPRTTSLHFRQILSQSPPSSLLSLFEEEFEDVDLSTDDDSISSSESVPMDNLSYRIAAALKSSAMGDRNLSSLSSGNASIIRSKSVNSGGSTKNSNRLSSRLFSWGKNKRHSAPAKPSQQPPRYDNGRAELLSHGVQVKEIQSTLHPIVVSSISHIYPAKFQVYEPTEFARY